MVFVAQNVDVNFQFLFKVFFSIYIFVAKLSNSIRIEDETNKQSTKSILFGFRDG